MRERLDYTAASRVTAVQGFDPDTPIAGHYRMRLRSGAVPVGIRIWYGAPLDPIDGTELDRSHRWQAQANGRHIELERVWPKCADDPIPASEYQYLTNLQTWAIENAPKSPHADPMRRIDPLTAPTPF